MKERKVAKETEKVVAKVKKTKKVVKIRSNFPETWLWSDETIK